MTLRNGKLPPVINEPQVLHAFVWWWMVMQPTMTLVQWSSIIPKSKDIEGIGTDDDHKKFRKRNLAPRYVYSGVVLWCEMCLT
jgi:hypothetical protein